MAERAQSAADGATASIKWLKWLPKENWLADFVGRKATGRKVLVYVRQTGTRDIKTACNCLSKQMGCECRSLAAMWTRASGKTGSPSA